MEAKLITAVVIVIVIVVIVVAVVKNRERFDATRDDTADLLKFVSDPRSANTVLSDRR